MSATPKLDLAVFIGRFQPFHNGHLETLKQALAVAENVLILIGSANVAPTIRNPWSVLDRRGMILRALTMLPIAPGRVEIDTLDDVPYNDNAWVQQVQKQVAKWSAEGGQRTGIMGFKSDHTSYYLDLFPQWETVTVEEKVIIHATDVRRALFTGDTIRDVPDKVVNYLDGWKSRSAEEYRRLQDEYQHIESYKRSWAKAPYPPTFVTTDAVVVQSGHVLLVQRKAAPGEGLWALPGGFLNQLETLEEGMLRELREETKLKVPLPVLRGSIKGQKAFDQPDRSLRGRTVTNAFYIELAPGELPKVKGSDDARDARWILFDEFVHMERVMFEDHHAIVRYFTKL